MWSITVSLCQASEFQFCIDNSRVTLLLLFLSRAGRPLCLQNQRKLGYRLLAHMATEAPITVPEGFTLHTENTSHILLPPGNQAFLNPVQEFNRDLSVACIRTWSEMLNEEKENKWKQAQERRAKKLESGSSPKAKRTRSKSMVD